MTSPGASVNANTRGRRKATAPGPNPWDSVSHAKSKRAGHQAPGAPSTPGEAMSRMLELARETGYAGSEHAGLPPEVQKNKGQDSEGDTVVALVMALTRAERAVSNKQLEMASRPSSAHHRAFLDTATVQAKADKLAHAALTLRQMAQNKDVVLARLQQPAPGSYLPVETAGQADFLQLIKAAALDTETLRGAGGDLEWAASFDAPGTVWAELPRHLTEGVANCREQRARLLAAKEGMASLVDLEPTSGCP